MRTPARLNTDQTRTLLFEKSQNLRTAEPSVEDSRAVGVSAMDLKHLFSQIQTDGNFSHEAAPFS
jgi:hypothetical protein